MREISNHFVLIRDNQIAPSLLMGENIAVPSGAREFSCTSRIIFDQAPASSDAGSSWTKTFRGVTPDRSVLDFDGCKAYIGFYLTDGSIKIIGDVYGVPVVRATPHCGAYVVETTFQTPLKTDL